MGRVRRFRQRSRAEKRLFAEAVLLVPLVRVGLGTIGFRGVRAWLMRRDERVAPLDPTTAPDVVDWAVQSVAKKTLFDRPCLTQSLVVSHFLRRAGYEPEVRIGVKKSGDVLEAHAWVELEGAVVSGGRRAPEIYRPLTSIEEFSL